MSLYVSVCMCVCDCAVESVFEVAATYDSSKPRNDPRFAGNATVNDAIVPIHVDHLLKGAVCAAHMQHTMLP